MIKEMLLENVSVEKGEEKNMILQNASGKIIKIKYDPIEDETIRLRVFTKEGEEVLNVTKEGLYYPRALVSSQRMEVNTAIDMEGAKTDYFYFTDGLLFNFAADNENYSGRVIKKVIIVYDGD